MVAMSIPALPLIYVKRESVAQMGTMLLGLLMAYGVTHMAMRRDPPVPAEPIRISLVEPPPQVEPPKLPPLVEPPPRAAPPKQPIPLPKPSPPLRQPPAAVTPVATTPSPAPAPVSLPELPVAPLAKAIPEKAEAPLRSNGAAEGRFTQDVRTRIEQKKVYPDTARDLGMSGSVDIVYVLDRAGKLIKAEIAVSSGYPLLDQAAARAVRSASYSAFPEDAWVGETQKKFRTKLVFTITD